MTRDKVIRLQGQSLIACNPIPSDEPCYLVHSSPCQFLSHSLLPEGPAEGQAHVPDVVGRIAVGRHAVQLPARQEVDVGVDAGKEVPGDTVGRFQVDAHAEVPARVVFQHGGAVADGAQGGFGADGGKGGRYFQRPPAISGTFVEAQEVEVELRGVSLREDVALQVAEVSIAQRNVRLAVAGAQVLPSPQGLPFQREDGVEAVAHVGDGVPSEPCPVCSETGEGAHCEGEAGLYAYIPPLQVGCRQLACAACHALLREQPAQGDDDDGRHG